MQEQKIGVVTHFFGKISVAIVKITEGSLKVGDTIHIKGHTTDLEQKVESMQIKQDKIQEAKVGNEVGIKISEHAREHDEVFKVTAE